MLKYFLLGFLVKIVTGLDDTITHVPLLASVAKTRMGKVAFSIGTLLAVIVAIMAAFFFSAFLRQFEHYRTISALLVFALAVLIFFDVFVHEPRARAEQEIGKYRAISARRFTLILGVGFVASVATVIDDVIAYTPLFLVANAWRWLAIAGILLAALLEVVAVVYFAGKIAKIPYKEEIASAGLVVLGILILTGVL